MLEIKYKYTYSVGSNKKHANSFVTASSREAALSKINLNLNDIRKKYRKIITLLSCDEVGSIEIIKVAKEENNDCIATPEKITPGIIGIDNKNYAVPVFFSFLYESEIEDKLHQITGNIVLDVPPIKSIKDLREVEEKIQNWAIEEYGHQEHETAVILLNWKYFTI